MRWRVLGSKRLDHRGRRLRHQSRDAADAKPGQTRPFLIPVVNQQGDLRACPDIPHASEGKRVGRDFGLLINRRPDHDTAVVPLVEDVANRHQPGSAAIVDRREDRAPRLPEELALAV